MELTCQGYLAASIVSAASLQSL